MNDLEICYLPSQWRGLAAEKKESSVCVVIDVIRATSTLVAALAAGADGVQTIAQAADAFALKAFHPEAVLAGERRGAPLPGFDLGNSPGDFTPGRVAGRRVLLTTTNGTQAIEACRGARAIVAASLLNLGATAELLRRMGPPWILVCAGGEGSFGVDDALVAGGLAEALGQWHPFVSLYRSVRSDLAATLLGCRAGQELVKIGLERDISFCAQLDFFSKVPVLEKEGLLFQVAR